MRVTVVIATRNRRDSLLRTLRRLRELPERPEIVVVDNRSSDGSADAVRGAHPGVHVIEMSHNLGAAARTIGALAAGTPYIAFCDDDSWWAPGALDRAAELLCADDRLGLVAARIVVEPGGRADPTCQRMQHSELPDDPILPGRQVLGFLACGAVVRRSAFLGAGGFDQRLQLGGEEALVSIDLAAGGWRLLYSPEVVAHHHPHSGNRDRRSRRSLRNALWTAWLRRPLPRALALSARLIADAGPEGPVGLADALRGLPWIVRERRVVPAHLERSLRALER
jgi:GT2 family glycosyltransferase